MSGSWDDSEAGKPDTAQSKSGARSQRLMNNCAATCADENCMTSEESATKPEQFRPEPGWTENQPPSQVNGRYRRPFLVRGLLEGATTMGAFWRCFFDFFYPMNSAEAQATRGTGTRVDAAPNSARVPSIRQRSSSSEGALRKTRSRHRPDVSSYFAVTLVAALTSGSFLGADLLRENVGFGQIPAFVVIHPMSYILGCCVALLAVLLAVGDV